MVPAMTEYEVKKVRVAAFTPGVCVPSARFRLRQYIPTLAQLNVAVTEFKAPFGAYPPKSILARPLWAVSELMALIPQVLSSFKYDITFLQRELLSTLITYEPFLKKPIVLDIDDAVWLHTRCNSIAKIAKYCNAVICGNDFLGEHFSMFCKNIFIIPTAVDIHKFKPGVSNKSDRQIIGWSGLSSGFKYLYAIEEALAIILKKYPNVTLRVVANSAPKFKKINCYDYEFISWTPDNEANTIQEMTVGLMPLDDSLWSRGKCSYKMLLYMSCGVPVVVSAVGMNNQILQMGEAGFGVTNQDDWVERIGWLIENPVEGLKMGLVGRDIVKNYFSVEKVSNRLADVFNTFS